MLIRDPFAGVEMTPAQEKRKAAKVKKEAAENKARNDPANYPEEERCPSPRCRVKKETWATHCWVCWWKIPALLRAALNAARKDREGKEFKRLMKEAAAWLKRKRRPLR